MSKLHSFLLTGLLFLAVPLVARPVTGVVVDASGQPVAGARVTSGARTAVTDAHGAFAIESGDDSELRVSHAGYRDSVIYFVADSYTVTLRPALAETIEVSGIRAEAATPVTKTDIGREEIEKTYYGQDVPLLMRQAPAIHSWAESGAGGSGYSYITLRGVSPTRINFTLDGVPLADSEDMGTYFADFPDLAHSLQSIQIQRGVGTSTFGTPSFGGSVNLQSVDLAQSAQTSADVAVGSFGTRQATVGYQTGLLAGGISAYGRVSFNESDGFRDNSGIRQRNIFVSAAKQGEDSQLRLTGFSGHEKQHLSFFATDEATLQTDLRANPLVPEETDSFGYDLAQLQYLKALGTGSDLTASVYYQRGYGSYRLYDDNVAREGLRSYGLDGMLLGTMMTYSRSVGALTFNTGAHLNRFRREHTRDLVDGPRDYYNYGVKQEANAFAKVSFDRARTHLYGDAQVRYADFNYHGDVDIDPISWTFFNPRVGARYDLTGASGVYASVGISHREPTRNDMFLGEDNASVPHDLHAVRPERLFNAEAGWDLRTTTVDVKANVYAMEFHDEIASTGELSEIGLLLRRNVPRSYRRGVELDLTWQPVTALRFRTDANLSRNRISRWTQFYDVYDADGNWIDSAPVTYRNVTPVLTPSLVLNQGVEYSPSSLWTAGAVGRWVGSSYLDNTNNRSFRTPSFFTLEANFSMSLSRWLPGNPTLGVQVNNILNNERIYGSGYDYTYFTRGETGQDTLEGTSYFFPQATRHAIVTLGFRL